MNMSQAIRLFTRVAPLLLVALAGCTSEKAFVRVSVVAAREMNDVVQLRVVLDDERRADVDTLLYPKTAGAPFKLTTGTPVTFSVSLSTSRKGPIKVGVVPRLANGSDQGYGEKTLAMVDSDDTNELEIIVDPDAAPPVRPDGGVSDVSPGPGNNNDALALSCNPTVPSTCTTPGRTCTIGCLNGTAAAACTLPGNKQPGEACTNMQDCVAGSQCFEFNAAACGTTGPAVPRACLKFCMQDQDCGGGGARCVNAVQCSASGPTPYKFCSRPCDPTGAAMNGCAAGLFCFITPGEIPDCNCRATTRTGGDGQTCTDDRNCQPGFICVENLQSTQRVCRPLCRLSAPSCAAGRTCEKLVMPDYQTFGACLP
jgi:hypothetical protein